MPPVQIDGKHPLQFISNRAILHARQAIAWMAGGMRWSVG